MSRWDRKSNEIMHERLDMDVTIKSEDCGMGEVWCSEMVWTWDENE